MDECKCNGHAKEGGGEGVAVVSGSLVWRKNIPVFLISPSIFLPDVGEHDGGVLAGHSMERWATEAGRTEKAKWAIHHGPI